MTKQQMMDREMYMIDEHMRVLDYTVLEGGVSVLVYESFGGVIRQRRVATAYDDHIVTSTILENLA